MGVIHEPQLRAPALTSAPLPPRPERLLGHPPVLHGHAPALRRGDHGAGAGVHARDGHPPAGDGLRPYRLLHGQVHQPGEWGQAGTCRSLAPAPRRGPGGGGVSKEGRLRGFGSPTLQLCRSPPPTRVCRGDFLWASLSRDSLAPTWSTPRASQRFPALHLKLCFHSVSKIDVHSPLTVQALQGQREPPTAAAPAPLPPDSQTINCYMSLYVMSESK